MAIAGKYHNGLQGLIDLDQSAFKELIDVLGRLPGKVFSKDTSPKIVSSIKSWPSDKIENIADAVLAIGINRSGSDKETTVYIEEFVQSLEKIPDENQRNILKTRLAELLNIKPYILAAKATSVLYEYDHTFGRARIMTDIRPIFDVKVENVPLAAMITHTLCIHYQEDNNHKEFFVSMDDNDLQMLSDVLGRAKAKSQSLQQTIAFAKIPLVKTA